MTSFSNASTRCVDERTIIQKRKVQQINYLNSYNMYEVGLDVT